MTVFWNRLRKRWQYDFRIGGKRFAGYADDPETGEPARSRRQAESIAANVKGRIEQEQRAAKAHLRRAPPSAFTLAQAMAYYAEHVGQHRRSWRDIKEQIRELLSYFGAATPVETLSISDVRRYIAWSRDQEGQRYVGGCLPGGATAGKGARRAASTTNKFLNTLRAALDLSLRDEKIAKGPKVPREREPDNLPNPIQQSDLELILSHAPRHLRDVILLCTMTGMRQDECLSLAWQQVNLDDGVITLTSEGTKSGKGRTVYLNEVARSILERIATERPNPQTHTQHVILYQPR